MAQDLSQILQAAKDILQEAGRKGMHIQDIAEAAVLQNKNMGMTAETFCKKLGSALAANLKLKSTKPTFAKVNWDKGKKKGKPRMGWYRLRQEKITPAGADVQVPKTVRSFLGCAGEYAVMSELLFWEYNVSMMTVDDGVDIVASKNDRFFYIQVKSATCQEGNKYTFSISTASFNRYDTSHVFYVFVLRNSQKNDFIVMHQTHLKFFLDTGVIGKGSTLSLNITHDAKKSKYTLNGKGDVTPFFGKFDSIK